MGIIQISLHIIQGDSDDRPGCEKGWSVTDSWTRNPASGVVIHLGPSQTLAGVVHHSVVIHMVPHVEPVCDGGGWSHRFGVTIA